MTLSGMQDLKEKKAALRREILARRDAIPPATRRAAADAIAGRPFPVPVSKGLVVSGYAALNSELNPLPVMQAVHRAGAELALPVVIARGKPLQMRAWSFGDPLVAGVWGISEPGPDAREVFPDILLVPVAAFDRRGYRIGYGGGYYDMTLARLRGMKEVIAVGLAFAEQEIEQVPTSPFDAKLDLVLTERETIDFRER